MAPRLPPAKVTISWQPGTWQSSRSLRGCSWSALSGPRIGAGRGVPLGERHPGQHDELLEPGKDLQGDRLPVSVTSETGLLLSCRG